MLQVRDQRHHSPSSKSNQHFIRTDNLATHKQLRGGVHFVTEMPRSANGKVARAHFKNMVKGELLEA